MYLKALEIQGFKSFPDKTRLTFEKDITAIVGPNGSGKSNISDSILWVMGEQRSKALRGGKMEDVIFGGTEKRPKMGFAQVSLIIDNTERIFDMDSSEVMITRRYYRSGESEYYINRESVRLRDITELLMDTGLGRYGYSIIGQGRISEVVSAKSEDRRELFEEAAGISRYRYRKDESERKLKHTEENLVRINDKIDELKIQVDPLREQAETAKKYLVLRDELRVLEVSVWMETLDKLQDKAKTVKEDFEKSRQDLAAAQSQLAALYEKQESLTEKMREKDLLSESSRQRLSESDAACAELESRLAVLKNSSDYNAQRRQQLSTEIGEQEERERSLEEQISKRWERTREIEEKIHELDTSMDELRGVMEEHEKGGNNLNQEMTRLISEKSEIQSKLSRLDAVISMLSAEELRQSEEFEKQKVASEDARDRKQKLSQQLSEERGAEKNAREKTEELNNIISGYTMRLEGRESRVKSLREKKTALTIQLGSLRSRETMLSEMEKDFEGYSRAVKTVMRETERGALSGVCGPVANLVKTENRYTLAIETALGGSMQSIVVDTQNQGKAAIELLKRRDAGRCTFLPVDTIKGRDSGPIPNGEQGYLGTAFNLCSFDPKYRNVLSNLLSRTIVTETLSDAVSMARRHDNRLRIVTLDGQLVNPGGSMTGGSAAKNAGILSRANELKAVRESLQKHIDEEKECQSSLSEAERELSSARYELQSAQFELQETREKLREAEGAVRQTEFLLAETERALSGFGAAEEDFAVRKADNEEKAQKATAETEDLSHALNCLEEDIEKLKGTELELETKARELSLQLSNISENRASLVSESEANDNAISQLQMLFDDLSGDSRDRKCAVEELCREHDEISSQLEEAKESLQNNKLKTDEIKTELQNINTAKLELEGKRTQCEKSAQDKNRELIDLERLSASIEQKKLAAEMEEHQIIDKLWDSYELSRTAAQSVRQTVENFTASTKRINSIRREISSLGNPNLGAIEEYDRVSTRYNFLTEQRDDVEKSKKQLLKIIADITDEMKEIFAREFKAIDESFRTTFLELFGGGRAALILEDEDDILGCGIEIKVQPPGKALSTISLMSGGEMAFVAIALYFAIIKVKPTPFCVMDEIEAALDEANVIRYSQYMRRLTEKTQFVVITHRRGTMEESDILYGVTMQEKGVSQVISVDLEEAERTISG